MKFTASNENPARRKAHTIAKILQRVRTGMSTEQDAEDLARILDDVLENASG